MKPGMRLVLPGEGRGVLSASGPLFNSEGPLFNSEGRISENPGGETEEDRLVRQSQLGAGVNLAFVQPPVM